MTTNQPRVLLLHPLTVNQIAAGEVVERPASVVKELVENAIDAGATRIEVELKDFGRKSIRVNDNGCGMSLENAIAAFQRHATSKIASIEDLSRVVSLGFRGEALPSIASVSRTSLSTGVEDGIRHLLRIEGGQMESPSTTTGPMGTDVVVEELFYNTPARLKFLKTDQTELSASIDIVQKYALAYPSVAFHLRHGSQTLLSTPGDGEVVTAISQVWGRDVARCLIELNRFGDGVRVRGFVSPPHFTKPTRSFQWLFVNGRPIRSRSLTVAIEQAYRSLTPERRHPVAVLMLDIDPARMDANVSPTKTEVKFQHEGAVFDAVRGAIKTALLEHGMIPSAEKIAAANEALKSSENSPLFSLNWTPSTFAVTTGFSGVGAREASIDAQAPLATQHASTQTVAPNEASQEAQSQRFSDLLIDLKILGQMMNTFIIAENKKGLLIIDQHVAHERILFEMLCQQRGAGLIEKQTLLVPETLHLDARSATLLTERMSDLNEVGFELEPFGTNSFIIRSAPAAIKGKNPAKIISDLIDELIETAGSAKLTPTRETIWITCACKMAIKAGDPLSVAEMEKLLFDLAQTENPYLCPHGRPITIVLEKGDLLRQFKRV